MDTSSDLWEKIGIALRRAERLTPDECENILKLLDSLLTNLSDSGGGEFARPTYEVINNNLLIETIQQRDEELAVLKTLSINLTSSLDLSTVLNAIVTEAMRMIKGALAAHIFLYHDGELTFGATLGSDGAREELPAMPREDGMTYAVARTGRQVIVEDISIHPLYRNAHSEWRDSPKKSMIGVPLKFNDAVLGVMNLIKSATNGFSASELSLVQLLADQAAIAISNASLHQIVDWQAHSDPLTGLPNRLALDERLEEEIAEARRSGYSFAAVMLDVDHFKAANDSYGHVTGDQILQAFSSRLADGLRSTDFLARYGGDEFALILKQADTASVHAVMEKLMERMAEFYFDLPDGNRILLGFSGGIAIFPLHGANAGDLLRASDEALYRAKRNQRGSFVIARGFTGALTLQER